MRPNLFDDPPRREPARPSRPMGIAVADRNYMRLYQIRKEVL